MPPSLSLLLSLSAVFSRERKREGEEERLCPSAKCFDEERDRLGFKF